MLSEEEKKAIEKLKDFKSISILYGNTFTMFLDQLEKYQEATNTVLNLITRLDKENKTTCKLNANMSKRHLNDIFKIKNYEKQIDLMAKAFRQDDIRSVEEIKQYFERKVEDERYKI